MAGRGSGGFVEQGVDVGGERGVGGPGLTDGEGGLIQLAGLGEGFEPTEMFGCRQAADVGAAGLEGVGRLTGGVGIGFWVWDEWNNLNVQHIIIAIFVIGIVGLLLENALVAIAKRFSFE